MSPNPPGPPFDLALVGGEIVHAGATRARLDLAYRNRLLAATSAGIDPKDAGHAVQLHGLLVVPGLVDIHAHVFDGIGDGASVDRCCLMRGTTTVVDGGSAGAKTIEAFRRIVAGSRARVLAWLNLSTIGLIDTRVGELVAGPHVDVEAAVEAARAHAGFVIGFKARLSTYAAGGGSHRILRALREAANATGLPVMVHIGDTDEPLSEILPHLVGNDVVTHVLTGRKHGILDAGGNLHACVVEARRRGVVFDAARGGNHLSFTVLAAAAGQGFLPDTLSTDMSRSLARDEGYSLLTIANYLLAVGVPLEDVIPRMTSIPATVAGLPVPNGFEVGAEGDATILRFERGTFTFDDVDGRRLKSGSRLVATGMVRAGQYYASVAEPSQATAARIS